VVTAALVFCAVAAGVFLWSTLQGKGGRMFFSPDTFQVRTQSELLLPLTEIPLYRSSFEYRDATYDLPAYLVTKGHWLPIETDRPQWILVYHWNDQWRDGFTELHRYLRYSDEWIQWTEANPQLANVLWPNVLSILRGGITDGYAAHLMFLARESSTVDEFRDHVNNDPELQTLGINVQ
jgi:hypothetical protein